MEKLPVEGQEAGQKTRGEGNFLHYGPGDATPPLKASAV
jgi:hypothetical protein